MSKQTDEHVSRPPRKHVHLDGTRCVLTNHGRWMRESQGISDDAECITDAAEATQ